MRELTFDDAFWRDVLAALREPDGAALERLAEARPAYAELVGGLARDARREPFLLGGRPATAGKNPRLFLLLTAALLARHGARTLYLDLNSELRWLEMLLGEDLKEGLVDHLQYDVALERCTRSTAIDRLDVGTGGAYFLTGSPLEDAPAFRAALETLRNRYDAVVVAFPFPFDAAEAAGMPALCEVWIAIEEGEVEAEVTGSERAVVRLVGDPQAAWDLARLSSAFLGPLPAILAGRGSPGHAAPEPAGAGGGPIEDEDEVAFLRAFEKVPPPTRGGSKRPAADPAPEAERPAARARTVGGEAPGRGERERAGAGAVADDAPRGRWRLVAVLVAVLLSGLVGVAFVTNRFDPPFAGSDEEPDWELEWDAAAAGDDGTMVALDDPADSVAEAGEPAGDDAETGAAAGDPGADATFDGEPTPYSLHVGSYQSAESGARVVGRLEGVGQTAFLAPVDLGERGRWYRVYAGAFADSSSAARTLAAIVGDGIVEEGAVRRTPWAYRVATHPTREAAEGALDALRGVSAYVVGDGPAVVWVGAFRSEEEAGTMATRLRDAGVDAVLTTRERPR